VQNKNLQSLTKLSSDVLSIGSFFHYMGALDKANWITKYHTSNLGTYTGALQFYSVKHKKYNVK